MKYCLSCGMPLSDPAMTRGDYCAYCTDEAGNLKPKEEIQVGVAAFLKQCAPSSEGADFMKRAEYYMKAMPAWAED